MNLKANSLDYNILIKKNIILGFFIIVFLVGLVLGRGFNGFKSFFPEFFKAAVVSNPAAFDDFQSENNYKDYLSQEELDEIKEIAEEITKKGLAGFAEKEEIKNNQKNLSGIEEIDSLNEKIDVLEQRIDEMAGQIKEISEKTAGQAVQEQELKEEPEQKEGAKEMENKEEETQESKKEEKTENSGGEITVKETAKEQIRRGSGISFCDIKPGASPSRDKVIINEIGWMGTSVSSNNEWIELKNISSSDVNLGNWQILDKESSIKINLGQGDIISANGYFLLERTDDNSIPDVLANFIYTGALNDTGEALYLFDSSCLLEDEAIASPDWPSGDKSQKKSMERSADFSWHTYFGLGTGTPGAENSSPYFEIENNTNINRPSDTARVVINEIQIDSLEGTGGIDDDWVELYNSNDFEVSLSGWSIQKHGSDEPCSIDKSFYKKSFSEEAIIPAKGFFLIVDTQANDNIKNIADMTIGWSLSSGSTVYLVKNSDKIENGSDSDIIDKVGFGNSCFPETNSAPEPVEAKSIERQAGIDTDNNSADFQINNNPSPS